MIKTEVMHAAEFSDADLVAESRTGDREAFGRIVERYQTLIASLAYCATGDLSRSEDLAQETFVSAWKQLPELREPAKLRPWLCSIAASCRSVAAETSISIASAAPAWTRRRSGA